MAAGGNNWRSDLGAMPDQEIIDFGLPPVQDRFRPQQPAWMTEEIVRDAAMNRIPPHLKKPCFRVVVGGASSDRDPRSLSVDQIGQVLAQFGQVIELIVKCGKKKHF